MVAVCSSLRWQGLGDGSRTTRIEINGDDRKVDGKRDGVAWLNFTKFQWHPDNIANSSSIFFFNLVYL